MVMNAPESSLRDMMMEGRAKFRILDISHSFRNGNYITEYKPRLINYKIRYSTFIFLYLF